LTSKAPYKGYAAPETKAAAQRARLLIEQAEALGEPPDDPLLLFSVLFGVWVANYVAFSGDLMRELAAQFLALAEKQRATTPIMIGHRVMGISLLLTGGISEGRAHLDQALALYDPAEHGPLATRFGQDARVSTLSYRSWALWLLGYPGAALADAEQALKDAREIGHVAALLHALFHASFTHIHCAKYAAANGEADELVALVHEKGAFFWKAHGMLLQGCVLALTGKAKRSPNDKLRDHRISGHGNSIAYAGVLIIFGDRSCGTWAVRGSLALYWRSDSDGGKNQGTVVRGRTPSHGRRNRVVVAQAGCGESGGAFRTCIDDRA